MKLEETKVPITYRLEQAQTALDDTMYFFDGKRGLQLKLSISWDAVCTHCVVYGQAIDKHCVV